MQLNAAIKKSSTIHANISKSQMLCAQLGFEVREVTHDRRQYEISFTENSFEEDIHMFRLVIPIGVHKLGSNYSVRRITRIKNGESGNIWVQWQMLVNGDFVLYSQSKFDGNILIEER